MNDDIEVCREISQYLYEAAPESAIKIIMRAKLSETGDHAKFEFDWIDSNDVTSWFTVGGIINNKVMDLLVAHRNHFVTLGQPPWKSCEFTVDVEKGKFSMILKYD